MVVIALLGACGGGEELPLGRLGERQAEAICARAVACCDAVDLDFAYGASDARGCEERIRLANQYVAATISGWEADGVVAFDGALAEACLADLAELSCREFAALIVADPWTPVACGVVPQVADGGACADSRQCTSGLCAIDLPRVCAPLPGRGDPCDGFCTPGNFCGLAGCEAQREIGEPCDHPNQCEDGDCLIDGITGEGACARASVCEG